MTKYKKSQEKRYLKTKQFVSIQSIQTYKLSSFKMYWSIKNCSKFAFYYKLILLSLISQKQRCPLDDLLKDETQTLLYKE